MYNTERTDPLGDQFPFVEGWINPSGAFDSEPKENSERSEDSSD